MPVTWAQGSGPCIRFDRNGQIQAYDAFWVQTIVHDCTVWAISA